MESIAHLVISAVALGTMAHLVYSSLAIWASAGPGPSRQSAHVTRAGALGRQAWFHLTTVLHVRRPDVRAAGG